VIGLRTWGAVGASPERLRNNHFFARFQRSRSPRRFPRPDVRVCLARSFVLRPVRIRAVAVTTGESRTDPRLASRLRDGAPDD
jgi:hypothetical protein